MRLISNDTKVIVKKIEDILISYIRFHMMERSDSEPIFNELLEHCKDYICGPPMLIYHWDTGVTEGHDVEACVPVTKALDTEVVKSRKLSGCEVLSLIHYGGYDALNISYEKLFGFAYEHGIQPGMGLREVYLENYPDNPDDNLTELQMEMHEWLRLLEDGLDKEVGKEKKERILARIKDITPKTDLNKRYEKLKELMQRLDKTFDEGIRYEILSKCADIFPKERIKKYKKVYEANNNVDDVLDYMCQEQEWLIPPIRKGNVIYFTKNPYKKKEYELAKDPKEKRKHYCHCPVIRNKLDEGMSPTYCYCGAGWFRQQWEGILETPIKIKLIKSLLNGDDICVFAIYLPEQRNSKKNVKTS